MISDQGGWYALENSPGNGKSWKIHHLQLICQGLPLKKNVILHCQVSLPEGRIDINQANFLETNWMQDDVRITCQLRDERMLTCHLSDPKRESQNPLWLEEWQKLQALGCLLLPFYLKIDIKICIRKSPAPASHGTRWEYALGLDKGDIPKFEGTWRVLYKPQFVDHG